MHYDLIIVGGGLVGSGLARALKDSPLKIALIEAKEPEANDQRLFALSHTSCQFLQNIGVWGDLQAHATAINEVHVSNQGRFGSVRLKAQEIRLPQLGFVIPAYQIESTLQKHLLQQENLTRFCPAKLTEFQQLEKLQITLSNNENLTATKLIAADGTHSTVRQLLNIKSQVLQQEQSALVTKTILQRSHQHIAYERFTKAGTIAMLPLSELECATIWTADKNHIDKLMQLSDENFLQELQQMFGYRLGKLIGLKKRFTYPLTQSIAEQTAQKDIILLGNAAHTFYPIAAQGFNLALYEVAIVVEQLQKHLLEIDFTQVAAATHTQRQTSQNLSQTLASVFAKQNSLIQMLIQSGMMSLDMIAPLKRKFLTSILGRNKGMPKLTLMS